MFLKNINALKPVSIDKKVLESYINVYDDVLPNILLIYILPTTEIQHNLMENKDNNPQNFVFENSLIG